MIALTLSACGANSNDLPGKTSSDPVNVEDTQYTAKNILMEDDTVITCLGDNLDRSSAVLTCVKAKDQSAEATPVAETKFIVEYIKLEDGTQLQCLTRDTTRKIQYRSAVIACVEQVR